MITNLDLQRTLTTTMPQFWFYNVVFRFGVKRRIKLFYDDMCFFLILTILPYWEKH